jgi:hypothetical protein
VSDKPTVNPSDVALLAVILSTGEWMLAREIAVNWRWLEVYPQKETQSRQAWITAQERKIRAVASASGGSVISYPGAPGYRLHSCATSEEIKTAVAKLRHQSAEMHARATAIERYGQPEPEMEQIQLGVYVSRERELI